MTKKKSIKKTFNFISILATAIMLTGCVGSNFVTGKLMEFNLKVVDNRYARGGVNFLLAPVYGFTMLADAFVVNSIEFWTGSNPFSGKPHIFDSKVDSMIKVNGQLDPSLHEAPIDPITFYREAESGTIQAIDQNTIQMDVVYSNGDEVSVLGKKNGEMIRYYVDGELVSETTLTELKEAFI